MKIIEILKGEKDVDQKSYVLWTLPFALYLTVLLFFTSESRLDQWGRRLMDMDPSLANRLLLLMFGLSIFAMVWILLLSAKRFDLFGQSPYMALWMLIIPASPVIYLYLALKKDLYYVKEREKP